MARIVRAGWAGGRIFPRKNWRIFSAVSETNGLSGKKKIVATFYPRAGKASPAEVKGARRPSNVASSLPARVIPTRPRASSRKAEGLSGTHSRLAEAPAKRAGRWASHGMGPGQSPLRSDFRDDARAGGMGRILRAGWAGGSIFLRKKLEKLFRSEGKQWVGGEEKIFVATFYPRAGEASPAEVKGARRLSNARHPHPRASSRKAERLVRDPFRDSSTSGMGPGQSPLRSDFRDDARGWGGEDFKGRLGRGAYFPAKKLEKLFRSEGKQWVGGEEKIFVATFYPRAGKALPAEVKGARRLSNARAVGDGFSLKCRRPFAPPSVLTANLPPCGGDVRPFDKAQDRGGREGALAYPRSRLEPVRLHGSPNASSPPARAGSRDLHQFVKVA